jgi:hypothetical protein
MIIAALVYDTQQAAIADVNRIDTALGFPNMGASTWDIPVPRWDGRLWIKCPPGYESIPDLTGEYDPDFTAWPEVP